MFATLFAADFQIKNPKAFGKLFQQVANVETVVEQYEGKDLNSPNDAVVAKDWSYWITDPDYGLGTRKKVLDFGL